MNEHLGHARFERLPGPEATALLRTHQVGRVAWESAEGPVILPVAYAWAEERIAFRAGSNSLLAALAHSTEVAFQIDEFDVDTGTGWSVLVRGVTDQVTDTATQQWWAPLLPEPWAPGAREVLIRLTAHQVSGRVVVRA